MNLVFLYEGEALKIKVVKIDLTKLVKVVESRRRKKEKYVDSLFEKLKRRNLRSLGSSDYWSGD